MVIFTQEKTGTSASALPFKLHGDGTRKHTKVTSGRFMLADHPLIAAFAGCW